MTQQSLPAERLTGLQAERKEHCELTLDGWNIFRVAEIPLNPYLHIRQSGELDGREYVVSGAFCEQDRRVL